jgi:hypothetical protein
MEKAMAIRAIVFNIGGVLEDKPASCRSTKLWLLSPHRWPFSDKKLTFRPI